MGYNSPEELRAGVWQQKASAATSAFASEVEARSVPFGVKARTDIEISLDEFAELIQELETATDSKKQMCASSSDPGTNLAMKRIKRASLSYPKKVTRECLEYFEQVKMSGGYDITSSYGKKIPRGICVVPKEDFSNPKLNELLLFAVHEHNKQCIIDGHRNLLLMFVLKVNYRVSLHGTLYYITLVAQSGHRSADEIYQVMVFACNAGCMELLHFGAPDLKAREIYELNKLSKLTEEEMKKLKTLTSAVQEKEHKFSKMFQECRAKLKTSSLFKAEVCDEIFVAEEVCNHWRPEFFTGGQVLHFKPFHLLETPALNDPMPWMKDFFSGKHIIDQATGKRKVLENYYDYVMYKRSRQREADSTSVKKIEYIYDIRTLRTRRGSYKGYLVRLRGKNGSRVTWLNQIEKAKIDQGAMK